MRKFSKTPVVNHYRLVVRGSKATGREARELHFNSLEELALGAWRERRAQYYDWVPMEAYTPRGSALPVDELVTYGLRLLQERRSGGGPRHVYRQGPVPNIRCVRGGGGYYRRVRTQSERRVADVFKEEGDVPPRAARSASNIPNSWDDIPRGMEHNWKSQHRGRKAWDRNVPGHFRGPTRTCGQRLIEIDDQYYLPCHVGPDWIRS